jgi:hypothetical protein
MRLKPQQLSGILTVGLVLKTWTSFGQENYAGYRHEYYLEDNHRMDINTDSAAFDVGLGEHLRLTGLLVQDAISGATPTGAPPPNQFPYPGFASFYNQDYSRLFRAAINNPNNLILYQSGYFANFQAYTNFVAQSNPQLGTQATNLANASRKAITQNPNFHNNTVPLTYLHDLRNALTFSTPITVGPAKFPQVFTPQASYSTESDYHSLGMSLNYALQLNQKNTTLNAGYAHDADLVRDFTLVHWRPKVTDEVLVGINQLLTPKSYITADFTYSQEHGYLSDPYRGVLAEANFPQYNPSDAALIPENRPRSRNEQIIYTTYNQYFDAAQGAMEVGYRGYHDSYGIFAHTFEASWIQHLGRSLILTPGFRYYNQTAAKFYYILVPDFDNLPDYFSSDYRLSEFQSFNISVTLTYRVVKWVSIDVTYSRYIMEGLDGVTSQSAYPSANVYSLGGRFWF